MKKDEKRVMLNDEILEEIVGGVLIKGKTVTNKETGKVYTLLVDSMTAFDYATKHRKESESQIISGMLSKGYIR